MYKKRRISAFFDGLGIALLAEVGYNVYQEAVCHFVV